MHKYIYYISYNFIYSSMFFISLYIDIIAAFKSLPKTPNIWMMIYANFSRDLHVSLYFFFFGLYPEHCDVNFYSLSVSLSSPR